MGKKDVLGVCNIEKRDIKKWIELSKNTRKIYVNSFDNR